MTPTTVSELPFREVWLHDFEFIARPGEPYDVVCLAAREFRSGQTILLWREPGQPFVMPYPVDAGALFISFSAHAELGCHMSESWPLPRKILDLSTEFRGLVNGRATPEGKGLLGALAYFGLDNIGALRKDALRTRIMQGGPFSAEEREQILRYCLSDVEALERLLPAMLPHIDLPTALYRGEFVAVSAQMQWYGVPIDREIYPRLADKRAWAAIRDTMVPAIDAAYGVYVQDPKTGEWSFNHERFEQYLAKHRIPWPRTESGKLNLKRKTFENMTRGWPLLEELRQLRHARDKMRRIKLAVGSDFRNRTVLWPFQSKTSRSQPKASEWIFSPAVWLRSLIRPEVGRAVACIDWSAMEFMLAAVLSNCKIMLDLYASGDPYLNFAKRVGAVPRTATSESHASERERYKVVLLATQYGMQAETLAARLKVSTFEAHEMLSQHRSQFAEYWAWSDDWVANALDTGRMSTVLGWECATGITELSERSIRNWAVQSLGAEIMRVACIMTARRGIQLIGSIHDALVVESSLEDIDAVVATTREMMRRASQIVLNATPDGPHELRTSVTTVRYPDRYSDKRGRPIWDRVLELLAEHEQQQEAAAWRSA